MNYRRVSRCPRVDVAAAVLLTPARGKDHAPDDEGEADQQVPVAEGAHHRQLTARDVEHGDPGEPEQQAEHHRWHQPARADLRLRGPWRRGVDRLLSYAGLRH